MSGDVPSVLASNESAKGIAGVKKPGIARKTEPCGRTRTPCREKSERRPGLRNAAPHSVSASISKCFAVEETRP